MHFILFHPRFLFLFIYFYSVDDVQWCSTIFIHISFVSINFHPFHPGMWLCFESEPPTCENSCIELHLFVCWVSCSGNIAEFILSKGMDILILVYGCLSVSVRSCFGIWETVFGIWDRVFLFWHCFVGTSENAKKAAAHCIVKSLGMIELKSTF